MCDMFCIFSLKSKSKINMPPPKKNHWDKYGGYHKFKLKGFLILCSH